MDDFHIYQLSSWNGGPHEDQELIGPAPCVRAVVRVARMRLTMYLLRDGAAADRSSLRLKAEVTEATVDVETDSIAGVFVLHGDPHRPAWLAEVEKIATVDLDPTDLQTRSLGDGAH
jgi:hypothetical protein